MKPVSYAHIYSKKGDLTTISNELGAFDLLKENNQINDTLIISHISYESKIVSFREVMNWDTIYIHPSSTVLEEVIVYDISIKDIINTIMTDLKNAPEQYGNAFYRQVSFEGEEPKELIEAFYEISYSSNGIQNVYIDQARFARKKYMIDKVSISHTNFSILTVGSNIFSPSDPSGDVRVGKPFSMDFIAKYDFLVSQVYKKDNNILYKIVFKPQEQLKNPLKSYGYFIYNSSNNKLVQFVMSLDHALGADDIAYNGVKTVSLVNPFHELQFDFSDQNGDLEFIKVRFTYDLIQDDETISSEVSSKFIIYQIKDKPHKRLREPTLVSEHVSRFENAKYKPKFWRDNPVIKLTPEEEAIIATFEKENAFGTYFK